MEKTLILLPICVVFASFSSAATLYGETLNATSCSQSDVQAAVNAATDGDTVQVPAGTCSWVTPSLRTPVVNIGCRDITLQGAGMDLTIINVSLGSASNEVAIRASDCTGPDRAAFRLTGFTFQGSTGPKGCINISGRANFRIDHNRFQVTQRGIDVVTGEFGRGVIDHNIFINTSQAVAITGANGDVDTQWNLPLDLGGPHFVFIEDNDYQYLEDLDGAYDAYGGARYVFRHNTVNNTNLGHHGLDSGGFRSPHAWEIYNNTFTADAGQSIPWMFRSRGGTGVLHNNTITGGFNSGLKLTSYRSCQGVTITVAGSWGRCDGNNPIDGNEDSTGYPCRDQNGRSTDADGDGTQDLQPVYEWDNTKNGVDTDISVWDLGCTNPSVGDHIKVNRDFYNDTVRPGYTSFTYPHPLVTEGVPNPPTNLRVTSTN